MLFLQYGYIKQTISKQSKQLNINLFFSIFVLFIFCSTQYSHANTKRFRHLTSDQGLSNNIAQDIIRDQNGFLWIATEDGLNRYDGTIFKSYKPNIHFPNGLQTSSIQTIYAGQNGYLWLGDNYGKLHRFDPHTEEAISYELFSSDQSQIQNIIHAIAQDKNGILWLASEKGLIKFNPQAPITDDAEFITLNSENSPSLTDIIYDDDKNELWMSSNNAGLIRYQISDKTILFIDNTQEKYKDLPSNHLNSLYQDSNGHIWTGGDQTGLVRIDPDQDTIQSFYQHMGYRYSLFHSQITDILSDNVGQIWVATHGNGVHVLSPKTKQINRYVYDRNDRFSLSHNIANKLYLDQENLVWIATRKGISKNNPAEDQIIRYTSGHLFTNGISGQNVQAILLDRKQRLWVGTDDGGLNLRYPAQVGWQHFVHHPHLSQSIPSNFISAICADQSDLLWVGSDAGLFTLNPDTDGLSYQYKSLNLKEIFGNKIISSCLFDQENMWVGTEKSGLYQILLSTGEIKHIQPDWQNSASLHVQALARSASNYLWIGTQWGINRLNLETGVLTPYLTDLDIPFSVNSIRASNDNNIWVATNIGLFRINALTGIYTHITEQQKLPSNTIQGIEIIDNNNIWLSTNNGLIHYNPQDGTITNFDETDGLTGNTFTRNSSAKGKLGQLYFGGLSGISSFSQKDLHPNQYSPKVLITDIKINFAPLIEVIPDQLQNKSIWSYVRDQQELVLPYHQNTIDFTYAATSLMAPSKNIYRVRLKGIDKYWRILNNDSRVFTYYGLAPGSYQLQLQGSNNNNIFSGETVEFNFRIMPPWWSTIWFKTIIAIAFLTILYWFYNFRFNVMRRYNRLLARQVYERTKQLAERTKDLAVSNQELQRQSIMDYMSGLYNRRHFMTVAKEVEKGLQEKPETEVCLILGDIDNFKQINDTYGHAVGDQAIKKTAEVLLQTLRDSDLVCRIGGEEFIAMLKNISFENALKIAERVRHNISEVILENGDNPPIRFTISIGASLWHPDEDIDSVMNRTDQALYQAKSSGRNCVIGSQHFLHHQESA